MSSQKFLYLFFTGAIQRPFKSESHFVCVCDWPLLCFFRMHPFCVKVSQRENEWQASLLPLPTYILLGSRNRKLLFADRIGCTIGRFLFARTCNWDLARAKGLIWAEKVKYYRLLRAIGSTEPISFRDMHDTRRSGLFFLPLLRPDAICGCRLSLEHFLCATALLGVRKCAL